jgi:hypothetical protein
VTGKSGLLVNPVTYALSLASSTIELEKLKLPGHIESSNHQGPIHQSTADGIQLGNKARARLKAIVRGFLARTETAVILANLKLPCSFQHALLQEIQREDRCGQYRFQLDPATKNAVPAWPTDISDCAVIRYPAGFRSLGQKSWSHEL